MQAFHLAIDYYMYIRYLLHLTLMTLYTTSAFFFPSPSENNLHIFQRILSIVKNQKKCTSRVHEDVVTHDKICLILSCMATSFFMGAVAGQNKASIKNDVAIYDKRGLILSCVTTSS